MAGIVAGIKSLSGINQGLATLNKQLDTIITKLKEIDNLSSKTASKVKQVATSGGQIGIGTSGNSQMAGSLAPVNAGGPRMPSYHDMPGTSESRARFFMRNGGGQMVAGAAQAVMGVAGAALSAMPGMDVVGANALGYYQASLGMGVNPMRLQQQTFADLAGGFSSTGSGASAAAILRGRYIQPGTAQFRQSMREVSGAFQYMGMANETAAAAIGGLQTGRMGANLYQYGINVVDPRTGKTRSTGDIARDLFKRMFPSGASREEVQVALQYGFAGANLRNMGFDEAQQQIFSQAFLDIGAGKNPDLSTKKATKESGLKQLGKMFTAESETIMEKQDAMLSGFDKGADIVVNLNKQLQQMPDAFFELKGATDAVIGSQVGGGLLGLGVAIQGLTASILGATMLLGASRGAAALGGGGAAASFLSKGGGALAKGGGILGGLAVAGNSFMTAKGAKERGEGFDWGNLLESSIGGAIAGFMVGGLPGAAIGAVAGGGAYVAGNAMGGPGEPNLENNGPILPVGDARVSSQYGMRQVAALGHTKPKMHKGTDYAVGVGTPVKVVNDGTVTRIENSTRGYEGWHILVDHGGGWSTLYAHLSQVNVRVGEVVKKGQVIGLSGTAGTGPHLHFEARKNGVATDPSQYMSGAKASKNDNIGSDDMLGAVGSSLGSSVGNITTRDISGVKGRDFKLSEMYGKQSATDLISGNYISMGSEFVDNGGEMSTASGFGNNPLGKPDLLKVLYNAGFKKPGDLAEAYAIAMAESNGRPKAYNGNRLTGDDSYGIFQINMIDRLGEERLRKFKHLGLNSKEDLFNPELNARIAAWMSQKGGNWSAWSSYGNSRYQQFLPSEEELTKTMAELGLSTKSGVGGGTGSDGTIARMAGSAGSSSTIVNHAGNTVNITVKVEKATEAEAVSLAKKVKQLLQDDKAFSAMGGQ